MMMLGQSGIIHLNAGKDIMAYDDKMQAKKVSWADLAKKDQKSGITQFLRQICAKKRREREEKQEQGGFLQSAGSEGRVL